MAKDTSTVDKKELSVIHGAVGTDIFSGYIDVDYQSTWKDLNTRIEVIEKMKWGDSSIAAILDAMKNPILSANYFVEAYSQEGMDEEIAEFIRENLFERVRFQTFLQEALTYLDYGFALFEKIYDVDGKSIVWKKFEPRQQKSIEKWEIAGSPWVNGHPAGVTQQINNSDDVRSESRTSTLLVTIPWNKLIRFTNRQEGNNFEGESVLRRAYPSYFYKELLYKIGGIATERYGVGLPFMKLKSNVEHSQNLSKYEELLKNIRSNEQAYALFDSMVEEFGILTPKHGSELSLLIELIKHHDRKIYDSVHAGFLNLTNGEGGSNALSKDQSSFFLRGLQQQAKYICDVVNDAIEELVILNFGEQKGYPKLCVTDIGKLSLDEQTNAITSAKQAGLLSWGDTDENALREELGLPEKEEGLERSEPMQSQPQFAETSGTIDQFDDFDDVYKAYHESVNMSASELEAWSKTEASKRAGLDRTPIQRNLSLLRKKKSEWSKADIAKANKTIAFIARMKKVQQGEHVSKDIPYSKRDIALRNWGYNPSKKLCDSIVFPELFHELADIDVRPSKRERIFMKNISDFENYLASEWNTIEEVLVKHEAALSKGLTILYEKADTTLHDGKRLFASTGKNTKIKNEALKFVDKVGKKLSEKLIDSPIQDRLFEKAKRMAVSSVKDDRQQFADEIKIDEKQYKAFINGYISNVEGVLFNEPRRIKENVVLNFGSQVEVDVAIEEAGQIKFNRNIAKLSTVTHARAAYTSIQFDQAQKDGFQFFKVVAPKSKIKDLKPSGLSASLMYKIYTPAQLTEVTNNRKEKATVNPIQGLNVHHGAFLYFFAVASITLAEERKRAEAQRKALMEELENREE